MLVLEVLAPSTAAYDRGQKFLSPQKLPGLQEYALVDAHAPRLEVQRRNPAGRFELYVFEGADCEADLVSIGQHRLAWYGGQAGRMNLREISLCWIAPIIPDWVSLGTHSQVYPSER